MAEENKPLRFLFILILVAVVGWLGYFSFQKAVQSELRAEACHEECDLKGHSGYDFRWNVLSGPQCRCLP